MSKFIELMTYEKNEIKGRIFGFGGQPKFALVISYTAQNTPMKLDAEWISKLVQESTPPNAMRSPKTPGDFFKIVGKGGDVVYTDAAGKAVLDVAMV
jgi:hypothetical protein